MKLNRWILVIDDEQVVRDVLTKVLGYQGHNVITAASGSEGLALFEPDKFDLVFTDYCMPGMTGDKVAAMIKQRVPTQPVVAITGFIERIRQTPVPWFDDYIGKPFALAELQGIVERYVPS